MNGCRVILARVSNHPLPLGIVGPAANTLRARGRRAAKLGFPDTVFVRQQRLAASGHTLIEILLALGLSLVILTAVYAALDQHWRYAEAGQRQTERMQVTRALFERVSLDLRSALFRPSAGSERAGGSSGLRRIDARRADEFYVNRSMGIVGDGETLVVQIHTPSIEGAVGSQTVRWEMQEMAADVQDAIRTGNRIAGNDASERDTRGLVRSAVGGVAALLFSGPDSSAAGNDLRVPEVETVRFRYFARGSWFDRWDSVARQELPSAVEVTIGFRGAKSQRQTSDGQEGQGEYQLIVPVPAAEA